MSASFYFSPRFPVMRVVLEESTRIGPCRVGEAGTRREWAVQRRG